MAFNQSSMNNSITDISEYDHNGAILYTVITLLLYSLSLFCSLILNIDPDDQYYEKKWSAYRHSENKRTHHSSQASILSK